MSKELEKYFIKIGLNIKDAAVDEKFVEHVSKIVNAKYNVEKNIHKMLTYPVPKLGPDGTCSLSDELEAKPYDLQVVLSYNHLEKENFKLLLYRLNKIVDFLHREIKADWVGIYKKLDTKNGQVLVKLAYRGRPSRAEFPLNNEFARHSNNSTVGLNGRAVLINNLKQHLDEEKPYYECDSEVQSEFCVPIFSRNDTIIGIIDAESFQENFFDKEKIIKIAVICEFVSDML